MYVYIYIYIKVSLNFAHGSDDAVGLEGAGPSSRRPGVPLRPFVKSAKPSWMFLPLLVPWLSIHLHMSSVHYSCTLVSAIAPVV